MQSRRIIRRIGVVLLWLICITLGIVAINLIGIQLIGNQEGWSTLIVGHRWHFFAWRLCLYAGTVIGWMWVRKRVIQREASTQARARLLRVETAAVFAAITMEGVMLFRPG